MMQVKHDLSTEVFVLQVTFRGVGRPARLGGWHGRSLGVRGRAEHMKMGIDLYFYGGPGGSYQLYMTSQQKSLCYK